MSRGLGSGSIGSGSLTQLMFRSYIATPKQKRDIANKGTTLEPLGRLQGAIRSRDAQSKDALLLRGCMPLHLRPHLPRV